MFQSFAVVTGMVNIKPSIKRKNTNWDLQYSKKRKAEEENDQSFVICKNIVIDRLFKEMSSLALGSHIRTAVENNDIRKVLSLIKNGCNINARTNCGKTILHLASMKGLQQMSRILIGEGADLNAKDINGYTPLHFAIMYEQIHTASVLIKHGSNVQSSCNSENTPLHMACARSLELSRLLIDNDADINAMNVKGQTPIRFAISTNQFQVVNKLAKEGASIKEYLPLIKTAILQLIVNGHLYI